MACGQSIRLKRKWQHIYGYILSNQKKAGTAGLPCRFMPVSFGFVNSVPIIPADIIIDNNVLFFRDQAEMNKPLQSLSLQGLPVEGDKVRRLRVQRKPRPLRLRKGVPSAIF